MISGFESQLLHVEDVINLERFDPGYLCQILEVITCDVIPGDLMREYCPSIVFLYLFNGYVYVVRTDV